MRCIYADNAATTPLDREAFDAMVPYFFREYGNASQPYTFARSAKKALRESREMVASCIGAEPEEIFFTSGGTESNNWAIKGSAFADPQKGTIVTSTIEHHAILHPCAALERMGYPVVYIPVDSYGRVDIDRMAEVLKTCAPVRLVSVMLANNEIGTIQDISALAKLAHEHGALFHTDAVQALGHIPVNVRNLGVDMLSASAHKFNGPKGIGFLYIRMGTPLAPYADGGGQEAGMRAGTENVAAIVGMATALKNNILSLESTSTRLERLEKLLLNSLERHKIDFIRNGSNQRVPGNINLSFLGQDGESILHRLDLMGICVSTGSACDGSNSQISHVLKAIALNKEAALGTIRISLGKHNTEEDSSDIAAALNKIITFNRKDMK